MDEFEYNARIIGAYNELKKTHPEWSEDQLYTEAQSIVSNQENQEG